MSSSARSPRQDSQLSSGTQHPFYPGIQPMTATAGLATATQSSSDATALAFQREASGHAQLHISQHVTTGQSQHQQRCNTSPPCLPPRSAAMAACISQQAVSTTLGQPEPSHQAHVSNTPHEQHPASACHSHREPSSHANVYASGGNMSNSSPFETTATCPGSSAAQAGAAPAAPHSIPEQCQSSQAASGIHHDAACTPVHGCTEQQHQAADVVRDGLDSCGSNLKRHSDPARFRPEPAHAGGHCKDGNQQHPRPDQAPSIIARGSRSVSLLISMDRFLHNSCGVIQLSDANIAMHDTLCRFGLDMFALMMMERHMPCRSIGVCSHSTSVHRFRVQHLPRMCLSLTPSGLSEPAVLSSDPWKKGRKVYDPMEANQGQMA